MISKSSQNFYHKVKNRYEMSKSKNNCRFNVRCCNESCKFRHNDAKVSFSDRCVISQLFEEHKAEMSAFVEEKRSSMPLCSHHLLCFEVECPKNHDGIAQQGRKILIKAFNKYKTKQASVAKIQKDIEKIKSGESERWEDMCD